MQMLYEGKFALYSKSPPHASPLGFAPKDSDFRCEREQGR